MAEEEGYSEDFLDERRVELERILAEITGRSRETLQLMMDQEREVGDSVDTSNEEQGTSTLMHLKNRDAGLLKRVEQALDRLAAKEYGECVECGEWISPRRLEAQPTAALCIDCKEEVERDETHRRTRPGLIDEYM